MEARKLFDGCVEIPIQGDMAQITLELPTCNGVCLFSGVEDKAVLLLTGANLRGMVRRRLAEDGDKEHHSRIRPVVERVWFRRCFSWFESRLAYFHIAAEVYPDSYEEFFPDLSVWFVHVDPSADYPFFVKTRRFESGTGLYWGPFADARSAGVCVDVLQDIFDLCRCREVLAHAPDATACSYGQMNRCVCVCDGSVSVAQYRENIDRAIDFLNRPFPQGIEALHQKMKELSESLQFEEAQRLKKKVTEAKKLLSPAFRWIGRLEHFLVMAFQPGPPIKLPDSHRWQPSISPFLIGPGWVDQIEPFPLADTVEGCKGLPDHLNLALLQDRFALYGRSQQQLFAWIAHLLNYRRKNTRDRGLYLRLDRSLRDQRLGIRADKNQEIDTGMSTDVNILTDELAQKVSDHFKWMNK